MHTILGKVLGYYLHSKSILVTVSGKTWAWNEYNRRNSKAGAMQGYSGRVAGSAGVSVLVVG